MLRGANAVYVSGVESTQIVRVADQTGTRLPAGNSAAGRVLLAALPLERVRTLYPDGTVPATDRVPQMSRDELERKLASTRRRGYEVARGTDFVSVAVPLVIAGKPMTALGVAAPPRRGTNEWQRTARSTLLRVAQEIQH
ncbi:IclR family transcriptional regulator C-terminal domain-containing protein [Amycolatopsis sp. NPDC051061]|uniref:IclR family transcriptional regulator domain-containing protein n=1 Tax=Amycolatopsis sp. NPDC051061 TaxID=3155042 RepID=UPI00342F3DEC